MAPMLYYLPILGALVSLTGMSFYVRDTLRGVTQPNRISFFFWALAPLIGSAAAFSSGVRLAALPVFIAGLMPTLIFASSFVNKKSYWKLEFFDYLCGACCAIALALWVVTKNPLHALIFSIIGDGFATTPALKKAFTHPESESWKLYAGALFNQCTAFFAMQHFNVWEVAFPSYLVLCNGSILYALYYRRVVRCWSVPRI